MPDQYIEGRRKFLKLGVAATIGLGTGAMLERYTGGPRHRIEVERFESPVIGKMYSMPPVDTIKPQANFDGNGELGYGVYNYREFYTAGFFMQTKRVGRRY